MAGSLDLPELIAVDVDGTIAGADHVPSARTVAALRRLAGCGIAGVIVTGRSERSVLRLADELGFTAPQISCNGALITVPATHERIWQRSMAPADARRAVAAAHRAGATPCVWSADAWYTDEDTPGSRLLTTILEEPPVMGPLDDVIAQVAVVKVMIAGEPDTLDASGLAGVIPGMERSMSWFFEAAPAGAGKKEAMEFLLDHLHVDPQAAWGFGDGGNDVGWLGLLGRVFAPENARDEVKAMADQVIGHHASDGVAEFLERTLGV